MSSRRSGPISPWRWQGSGSAVSPSRKQTIVGVGHGQRAPHGIALAERRAGLGEHLVLLDDASRRPPAATAAVPSVESASTTTISSTKPGRAAGPTVGASTPAIVAAHSLVGMTTAIDVVAL